MLEPKDPCNAELAPVAPGSSPAFVDERTTVILSETYPSFARGARPKDLCIPVFIFVPP